MLIKLAKHANHAKIMLAHASNMLIKLANMLIMLNHASKHAKIMLTTWIMLAKLIMLATC